MENRLPRFASNLVTFFLVSALVVASGVAILAGCSNTSQGNPSALPAASHVPAIPLAGSSLQAAHQQGRHRVEYILEDLGTFGGPISTFTETEPDLQKHGILAGQADTSTKDPYAPNDCFNPDCYVSHAFLWQNGELHDLGTLPNGSSSVAYRLNARSQAVGISQNGVSDPLLGEQYRAVLWTHGAVRNLGTLGGTSSGGIGMNDRGEVIGFALNKIPDPYPFTPGTTETRAFLWQDGRMHDLGTLGGNDSFGTAVNDRGQATGASYINNIPGPSGIPTLDPFFWEPKLHKMIDIGGFGGTYGFPNHVNSRGEVIGDSHGPGDNSDFPFLWHDGKLENLGTLGGSIGQPIWINDAGATVGFAFEADNLTAHATLWNGGKITDLGILSRDRCAIAYDINSKNQTVGETWAMPGFCQWPDPSITDWNAVLWEKGSVVDLNTLIAPKSPLHLVIAIDIDDQGDIAGLGVPSGVPVRDLETRGHAFVLIPCRGERAHTKPCGETAAVPSSTNRYDAAPVAPRNQPQLRSKWASASGLALLRAELARRYHLGSFNRWNRQF